MYITAWTHKCTDMHGYYPLSRDWQAAVKSGTVCVSVCVCIGVMGSLQADGGLDDGRLVHSGFLAFPPCFLSLPFLCSTSVHAFVLFCTSCLSEESPLVIEKC